MQNRLLILFITFLITVMPSYALQLDLSVDEEIKKKYNSSKLEYEVLPNLPKSATPSLPTKNTPTYSSTIPSITKLDKNTGIKISSGTKFKVKSNQTISDWSTKDGVVSFSTSETIYKKLASIPVGTKIYGKITDSHAPQITGNGGLVEIEITSITYNGKTYEAEGKIIKANSKKIFFNNIKGKRKYWKNVGNHISKGETFYKKTRNISNKMSSNPITSLLSPIPTAVGMIGCTVCTILSPITAIGTKGENISIPAGSSFEIKLTNPTYVQ